MTRRPRLGFRRAAPLRRFAADIRGVAAVEFALALPVMLLLWIGGVEVTQGLSVDRRVNELANSIADLASRTKDLRYADVEAIFDLGPSAMYPYVDEPTSMVLSAVDVADDHSAKIAWSRARGRAPRADGTSMTGAIAPELRVPGTQIIMAEVFHRYRPALGYALTGTIDLEEESYYTPRVVKRIRLCDDMGKNCR